MMQKAIAAIIERDGRVLLGKKATREGHPFSEEWHLPGGKLNFGETPEEALVREVKEETNLAVEAYTMILKTQNPQFKHEVYWFSCSSQGPCIAGDDLVDIQFVEKKDVLATLGANARALLPKEIKDYLPSMDKE